MGGRQIILTKLLCTPPPPPDFQTFRRPWDVSHTRHHAGLLLIVSARYAAEPCFFSLQSESETFLNSLQKGILLKAIASLERLNNYILG